MALKLVALGDQPWTYESLAADLGMSASGVHAAVARASASGLLHPKTHAPIKPALLELLVHGVRYVFPAVMGRRQRGIPTGPSAAPLVRHLASTEQSPLVWPYARGDARGESIEPLYETVPGAASRDAKLYAMLATVDGLRVGGARVREVSARVLEELLRP